MEDTHELLRTPSGALVTIAPEGLKFQVWVSDSEQPKAASKEFDSYEEAHHYYKTLP